MHLVGLQRPEAPGGGLALHELNAPRRLPALPATPEALRVSVTSRRRTMRTLSSRSSSVRPAAAAILLGAALVVPEPAAPAAHAAPRLGHPGVARPLARPRGYGRPPRRLALAPAPARGSIPL